jgi:hypothetical protein
MDTSYLTNTIQPKCRIKALPTTIQDVLATTQQQPTAVVHGLLSKPKTSTNLSGLLQMLSDEKNCINHPQPKR